MFDDLDDPSPDLRTADTLGRVLADGRALRRRRRLQTAAGVGVAAGAVLVAALVVPPALDGTRPSTLVPAATSSVPPPDGTIVVGPPDGPDGAERATPPPGSPRLPYRPPDPGTLLVLGGDNLGVTEVGRPRLEAVAAVSAALGVAPDDPAVAGGRCGPARLESTWAGALRLAFDPQGRLVGWLSSSRQLYTPSGVMVGTTVQRLRQVYGSALQLRPGTSDHGPTYTVKGVDMTGFLSSADDDGVVEALANGTCVPG